ncbi:hypothetical protein [Streptomyces sp. NPDC001037]|uniref:hypothetical protein n=1 Tax=Streptomyces sp. NPDC001037 TaxID=3364542 RepID=UPI0036CDF8BC
MDPEVVGLLTSSLGALVALMASDSFRRILKSIVRRPRETSLIIKVGDKRVELSGLKAADAQATIAKLLSETAAKGAGATVSGHDQSRKRSHGAEAAAGGQADD